MYVYMYKNFVEYPNKPSREGSVIRNLEEFECFIELKFWKWVSLAMAQKILLLYF